MIGADVLEKLKGFAISRRDRQLIYTALAFIATTLGYIVVRGQDTKLFRDIAANLIWAGVALVVVFVAGSVEQRRIAAKTLAPPPAGETKP